ncbi:MAG: hypothetical protein DRP64_04040 [Verrucomicrobia bacterium]|nr:MAG: hypothetical protein DRP64_04040 [Verrucomicrobiota bacterium]
MRILCTAYLASLLATAACAAPESVLLYDFAHDTHGWTAVHDVAGFKSTGEGLEFDCTARDPYVCSPPMENMPIGNRVLLTLRMKSDGEGKGQIFFGRDFAGERMVSFAMNHDGKWHEYEVLLPVQEPGTRLRIDPAMGKGHITIAWIKTLEMKPLMKARFGTPQKPKIGEDAVIVRAGDIAIEHGERVWGGFAVTVDGKTMAIAHAQERIGIMLDGKPAYLDLAAATFATSVEVGTLKATATMRDAGGARWILTRTFTPLAHSNAIAIATTVEVDTDRELFHLPMLTLFPGMGTFGHEKTQAVLPGVEYLANEPSSSEADVKGEKANRRIVDDFRLCSPMMGIVVDGRYLGLAWDRRNHPAPVFDSPDRVFNSGGHLMALWYPAVGECRIESEFDIFRAFPIKANTPITLTTTIFGDEGATVNSVMAHYVDLSGGLPPLPEFKGGLQAAVTLLAHGWLDSAQHHDGTWRHAVWGDNFQPAPVSDAPCYMLWLAEQTNDKALAARLREGAKRGIERVRASGNLNGTCSHVARPFAPLLFGETNKMIEARVQQARQALNNFDEAGLVRYRPRPDGLDYGSTHWEDHANGLSALQLEPVLEAATLSGDNDLATKALATLDKQLTVYRNTVPRGAQTWEMPLHTPDILASARILQCCNLAYLLTGDQKYIDEGRYWAWTGVSMIYLDPPTDGPVGLYATTAVLGATAWAAPYWIGQPVQWCGLVYRSALHDFAKLDLDNPAFWEQLAQGITRSGLQQTFPLDDEERQGLLPDFFHLKAQKSDGPAISPGTVQANLAEAYGATPIYDARRLGDSGMIVHVPGGIRDTQVDDKAITIEIDGWYSDKYRVRITHVPAAPSKATLTAGEVLALDYSDDQKTLDIMLKGEGTLTITR